MRPLAWLVLFSCPKSCLIFDTFEERVKSCKDKWENCGILLTPIADIIDVLWVLILLGLLLQQIPCREEFCGLVLSVWVRQFFFHHFSIVCLVGQLLASVLLGDKEDGNGE